MLIIYSRLFIPDNILMNETPMTHTNHLATDRWDESSFETSCGNQRCGKTVGILYNK